MSKLFYNLTVNNNFDKNKLYARFNLNDLHGNEVEGVYQYQDDIFSLLDYLQYNLEESEIEIDQSKPIQITIIPTNH